MITNKQNYFVTPGTHHDLLTKISHKGVTALKNDRRFRTRISGSRTHCVLPDGTLVDNRTRTTLMGPVELEGSKKGVKKEQKRSEIGVSPMVAPGIVENPAKIRHREYFVNEKLISARVYSYVSAMKDPVLHVITISFPPVVSDNQGFQYLNNWLTVCRESLHLRDYLFVAEYQENGTIHFHVLVPQYLNIVKANRAMVTILCNQIRKGKLDWNVHAAKRYNGVDLAKDRKTKKPTNFGEPKKRRNLVAYITKYVSKGRKPRDGEDEKKGFPHLAWHNSRGFSSMFTGVSLTAVEGKFLGLRNLVNFAKIFIGEFFSWLPWSANNPPGFFTGMLRTANQAILYNDKTDIHLQLNFAL
jgi:hypothetical protein